MCGMYPTSLYIDRVYININLAFTNTYEKPKCLINQLIDFFFQVVIESLTFLQGLFNNVKLFI